jgi:uncharacterized protein (TIGR02145 family)
MPISPIISHCSPAFWGKNVKFGYLYNWNAVMSSNNLAPTGWSVPSRSQMQELIDRLVSHYGCTTSTTASALKASKSWTGYTGVYMTNKSGFSTLAGGTRAYSGSPGNYTSGWYGFNLVNSFWTSTFVTGNVHDAWRLYFSYQSNAAYESQTGKVSGHYVRCIQAKGSGESDGSRGALVDIDGNKYRYVVIGNYRWMAENLKTTRYRNGVNIPLVESDTVFPNVSDGARCAYNNNYNLV